MDTVDPSEYMDEDFPDDPSFAEDAEMSALLLQEQLLNGGSGMDGNIPSSFLGGGSSFPRRGGEGGPGSRQRLQHHNFYNGTQMKKKIRTEEKKKYLYSL